MGYSRITLYNKLFKNICIYFLLSKNIIVGVVFVFFMGVGGGEVEAALIYVYS